MALDGKNAPAVNVSSSTASIAPNAERRKRDLIQFMQFSSRKSELLRDCRGRILRDGLEYSVVDHCNLRCAGCDHAAPHLTKRFADPEDFAADMDALSQHLHVRMLRLLGGEPLLHPQLNLFVQAARAAGIADSVMLWTNGLLLHKARRGLLESFDVVQVSLYPGVRVRADLSKLAGELEENSHTRLNVVKVEKFQHQLLNDPIADRKVVRRTYLRCKEAHSWSCHTVHDGRYYKCPKASGLGPRLAGCGVKVSNCASDGVALHQNPQLAEELAAYLLSTVPLMACAWCLGTDGKSFSHHQLDALGMALERQTRDNGRAFLVNPVRRLARDIRDSFERR